MKKFTLEFADNENFDKAMTATTDPDGKITTTASGDKSQTLSFVDEIEYTLADLAKGTDPTGRGASNTFTYYVREQRPTLRLRTTHTTSRFIRLRSMQLITLTTRSTSLRPTSRFRIVMASQ